MTKFKKAFLILYLVAAISSILMIYYKVILLETAQNWGYWLDFKQLPMIGTNLILLLSVLMLLEVIVQKFTISKLKNTISEQKDEVMSIKSKLYDQITNYNTANTEANDDPNQPSLEENEEY
ncbi:MAG: hypothetical protein CMB82_09855 [Flammeovirgaceae bacterium]|nr:hypothetical protein [Flammeovirgaceae bacterium]